MDLSISPMGVCFIVITSVLLLSRSQLLLGSGSFEKNPKEHTNLIALSILIYYSALFEIIVNPRFGGKEVVFFKSTIVMVFIAFICILAIAFKIRYALLSKVARLDHTWLYFVIDGTAFSAIILIISEGLFDIKGTMPLDGFCLPMLFLILPLIYIKGGLLGETSNTKILGVHYLFKDQNGHPIVPEVFFAAASFFAAIDFTEGWYVNEGVPLWCLPAVFLSMMLCAGLFAHHWCPTLILRSEEFLGYPSFWSIVGVNDPKGANFRKTVTIIILILSVHLFCYEALIRFLQKAVKISPVLSAIIQIIFLLGLAPIFKYIFTTNKYKIWISSINGEKFPHIAGLGATLLVILYTMRVSINSKFMEVSCHERIGLVTSTCLALTFVAFHPYLKKKMFAFKPVATLKVLSAIFGISLLLNQVLGIGSLSATTLAGLMALLAAQADFMNLREGWAAPVFPRIGETTNPLLLSIGGYGLMFTTLKVIREMYPTSVANNMWFTLLASGVYFVLVLTGGKRGNMHFLLFPLSPVLCTAVQKILFLFSFNMFMAWLIIILTVYLKPVLVAAFITLLDRKGLGASHRRHGPSVVGFIGVLQPISDALKLFQKVSPIPQRASTGAYVLAPFIALYLSLLPWILIPIGPEGAPLENKLSYMIFLGVSSVGIFPIILASWASNNSYAFLAASRVIVQFISFEIFLSINLMSVFSFFGTAFPRVIIEVQRTLWAIAFLPSSAIFFLIASLVESARAPFDLIEAEGEIIAGPMVEYGGILFMLFFLSEYVNIALLCLIFTNLYLGGYTLGSLGKNSAVFTSAVVGIKVAIVCVTFVWARTTIPRVRFNDLIRVAWKILLPGSIAQLFLIVMGRSLAVALSR